MIRQAPDDAAPEVAIAVVLAKFEAELMSGAVRCEIYAPLVGVNVPNESKVRFPGSVELRATSLDDLNRWHSDVDTTSPFPPSACLFAEVQQPRTSAQADFATDPVMMARAAIERAKRAMSVFKSGRLGDGGVHVIAPDSCFRTQLRLGSISTSQHIGGYSLTSTEVSALAALATRLEEPMWPALDFACERLVESERRWASRDAILDAVIGLEGLLLDPGGGEGLRYRFAMHLAAMVPVSSSAERRRRFREAYSLYGVRSKLAHTGVDAKGYSLGDGNLTGEHVAERAKDLLRIAVHEFLRHQGVVPKNQQKRQDYWSDFWERRLFGIGDDEVPAHVAPTSPGDEDLRS